MKCPALIFLSFYLSFCMNSAQAREECFGLRNRHLPLQVRTDIFSKHRKADELEKKLKIQEAKTARWELAKVVIKAYGNFDLPTDDNGRETVWKAHKTGVMPKDMSSKDRLNYLREKIKILNNYFHPVASKALVRHLVAGSVDETILAFWNTYEATHQTDFFPVWADVFEEAGYEKIPKFLREVEAFRRDPNEANRLKTDAALLLAPVIEQDSYVRGQRIEANERKLYSLVWSELFGRMFEPLSLGFTDGVVQVTQSNFDENGIPRALHLKPTDIDVVALREQIGDWKDLKRFVRYMHIGANSPELVADIVDLKSVQILSVFVIWNPLPHFQNDAALIEGLLRPRGFAGENLELTLNQPLIEPNRFYLNFLPGGVGLITVGLRH